MSHVKGPVWSTSQNASKIFQTRRWGDIAIKVTFASGWEVCPHTYTNGFAIPTLQIILNLPVCTSGRHARTCIIQVRCSPFQSHLVLRISTSKYLQFGCSHPTYDLLLQQPSLQKKQKHDPQHDETGRLKMMRVKKNPQTMRSDWAWLRRLACVSVLLTNTNFIFHVISKLPRNGQIWFRSWKSWIHQLVCHLPRSSRPSNAFKLPPPYRPSFQYPSHPWMLKEWFAIPEVNFYCYG